MENNKKRSGYITIITNYLFFYILLIPIMKQYVHSNKFFIVKPFYDEETDLYYYELKTRFGKDESEGALVCSENDLKTLWFIEKEEEPDTKWIDDAYMYFKSAKKDHPEMAIDVFKRAILSYMPR